MTSPTTLPTAPLTPTAAAAIRSLDLALTVPVDVVRAVTRYEIASARYAELCAMDARTMSGADFDSLALAQDTIADARATLAAAGRLDLIEAAS